MFILIKYYKIDFFYFFMSLNTFALCSLNILIIIRSKRKLINQYNYSYKIDNRRRNFNYFIKAVLM